MLNIVDNFIDAVATTAAIPITQALISTERLLAFADEEAKNDVISLMDSVDGEYFIKMAEILCTPNLAEYYIPYRAVGRKADRVLMRCGTEIRKLTQINPNESHVYGGFDYTLGFKFQEDKIVLIPAPTNNLTYVQIFYKFRPSKLVTTSQAGLVTGVSTDALLNETTITCAALPSTFMPGVKVDFIKGISGFVTKSFDEPILSVAGNQLVFAEVHDEVEVGDYVALAGETPVIQFPDEVTSYLAIRTAKRVVEAVGDYEAAKALDARIKDGRKATLMLLQPRSEGSRSIIINQNGLLRGRRAYRFFRGFTP